MKKMPHNEAIHDFWYPLLTSVEHEITGVLQTTVNQGGTRPVWKKIVENEETFAMAYPQEGFLRTAVIVQGEVEGKLEPMHVVPLLEGYQNVLVAEDAHRWPNKVCADVLMHNPTIKKSFWLHDPMYYRDEEYLQPDQAQLMKLGGIVYGVRRALLDEATITQGEAYEQHALEFLAANPDKSRLDVPPLKVPLQGKQMIGLGRYACEYQARVTVNNLDSFDFGPEGAQKKIYSFLVNLATEEEPMPVILYASEKIIHKGLELEEGMDIDIVFWLQGRVDD